MAPDSTPTSSDEPDENGPDDEGRDKAEESAVPRRRRGRRRRERAAAGEKPRDRSNRRAGARKREIEQRETLGRKASGRDESESKGDDEAGGEGKTDRKSRERARPKASAGSTLASARRGAGQVLHSVELNFAKLLALLGAILVGLWALLLKLFQTIAKPLRAVGRRIGAALTAVSRQVTPVRGLLVAAVACAILLALSQFADYKAISIGGTSYDPSIASVAPAPEVGREALGSAHSYLMIPVAIVAIVLLIAAAWTKRWQLCRLVFAIGLGVIAVAILVDHPAAMDVGDLPLDYNGVQAHVLGGFWMEVFAGAGLALTSLLLGSELRRERSPARGEKRDEDQSDGKGRTRRRPRRDPGARAEGAGA